MKNHCFPDLFNRTQNVQLYISSLGLYIDERCLYYQKPLIDSGTMGMKASAQVIVPFLTESYSAPSVLNVPSVPMCTLRSFPTSNEHTIKWARDNFADLFTNRPQQAQQFVDNSESFINQFSNIQSKDEKNQVIETVYRLVVTERPTKFLHCIVWV